MKIDPDAYYVAKINYTAPSHNQYSIWTRPIKGSHCEARNIKTVEEIGNFLSSTYLSGPYDSVEVYVLPTEPVVTVNSE